MNDAAGEVSLSGETRTDGTTGTAVKRRRTLAVVLPVVIVLLVAVALIFTFSVGSCSGKSDDEADIPQTAAPESGTDAADSDYSDGGTSDASGVSETYEGLSYTKKGSTYEVSYADNGTETEIVVPSSFNGVSVTSIGSGAFSGCSTVESIVIPDSVTSVGDNAFKGCKSLTEITIPQSVKSIGSGAFSGCSSLESMTLPFVGESSSASSASKTTLFGYVFGTSSYTGGVSTKQNYSSSYNSYATYYIPSSLHSVTITGGKILYGSFYNCTNISEVTITGNVSSLGDYAFYGCTSLEKIYYYVTSMSSPSSSSSAFNGTGTSEIGINVTIGANVTRIPAFLFRNASYITDIVFEEDSVCRIFDDYAFYGCSRLSALNIPGGVTTIGSYAFYNCSGLTAMNLPNGVSSIGTYAFYGCSSLENISIPDGVKEIGTSTFYNCSSLTDIVIPNSVTTIASGAFSRCSSLRSITLPFVGGNAGATTASSSTLFGYIFGSSSYTGGTSTKQYYKSGSYSTYYIPYTLTSVTILGGDFLYGSFYNCSNIKRISIGIGVTAIESQVFYNCTSLKEVDIADIGAWFSISFEDDSSNPLHYANKLYFDGEPAMDIVIPDSVTSIPDYAFYDCDNIINVTIGEEVTSIGSSAFYDCDNLLCVTLPKNLTFIGTEAFYGCEKLVQINNHSSLNLTKGLDNYGYIAYYALCVCDDEIDGGTFSTVEDYFTFYDYDDKVYLMTYIGSDTEIILPESVDGKKYEIYEYIFYNRTELESVVIGSSVTGIGAYAFYGCSSLSEIIIPDSVTSIGQRAFYGCAAIEDLTIGEGVTSAGTYAFYGCTALTEINFNAVQMSDLSSGNYVFYNAGRSGSGITVTIGTEVTKIPAYLFYPYSNSSYVPKVTAVVFEEGSKCKTIGSYAFYYCSNLVSVLMPNSITTVNGNAFGNCTSLSMIYYTGTAEEWNNITFSTSGNTYIINCTIYYYSETQPAENGNYWYYDDDGNPAIWRRT